MDRVAFYRRKDGFAAFESDGEYIFKDFSSGLGAKCGVLNFCQDLLGLRGQAMNCYEVASWMMENGISNMDVSSQVVKKIIYHNPLKRNVQALEEPEENKPIIG